MPIYEYSCKDCGCKFEKLVKNGAESVQCPSCSGKNSERLLSVFSSSMAGSPKCEMKSKCPSAGTSCCSGGSCGMHRH